MTVEEDCLEICDRLSKSLARGRVFEYGTATQQRFDRLDNVLENCSVFLAALDATDRNAPKPFEAPAGGYDAPNVIPFPWKARMKACRRGPGAA